MALLHSILVVCGETSGDLTPVIVERFGRLLLEYATSATAASNSGLHVSLSTVSPAHGKESLVRALLPVAPAGLIHFMLSGPGGAVLRSIAAPVQLGPMALASAAVTSAVASALEAICDAAAREVGVIPHLISVLSFGPWAMPSPQLQEAVLRAVHVEAGPSSTRLEFIRLIACGTEPSIAGLDVVGPTSGAHTLSGDGAFHNGEGQRGWGGSVDLRALAQTAAAAAAAAAATRPHISVGSSGGEAVPAFLRQVTRMLPHGAQGGAAADWLRRRGGGDNGAHLAPMSPLQSLPLVAAAQVSVGPTTLLALAHTWLALAAPAHLCVVSVAIAQGERLPAPPALTAAPNLSDWWLESSLGDDEGAPRATAAAASTATAAAAAAASAAAATSSSWLPGWRPGRGPDGGGCAAVGALPLLLSHASGSRSLDDLGPRIRGSIAMLCARQAVELRERRESGRPAKQPARWKGKAAEAAAAARVDVHLCWQRVADAMLAGPPAELRAVGLVQLSSFPLQYLAGGCCFQATVPLPPSVSAASGGDSSSEAPHVQAARTAAVAWQELLATLVTSGYGVLMRGQDTEMPLSCAGGGSASGAVIDVPVLTAWYVLLPDDCDGSGGADACHGAGAVAPAAQALLYRITVRDALAGTAACTALGLRALPLSASASGSSVATCGGGSLAGSGLAPASTFQALPLGAGDAMVRGSPPAAAAVSAILRNLLVASILSPLDLVSGVGAGHRALVARVDLATAFASSVVAAGLGDVLQPVAPGGGGGSGGGHARARKRPEASGKAPADSSVALAPDAQCTDLDAGLEMDGEEEDGSESEPRVAVAPAPPAAAAAPRKRPEGARSQPPPLPQQKQQQPAAAAFLAQVVRNRQQQGGARSPSPGAPPGGSGRGASTAVAPAGRRQAAPTATVSRQRKLAKVVAAAVPDDTRGGSRRVRFYEGDDGDNSAEGRHSEGDGDEQSDCDEAGPPSPPLLPHQSRMVPVAGPQASTGGKASVFRVPLRAVPAHVVCCDSESEEDDKGPHDRGRDSRKPGGDSTADEAEGALPSLGGLDCEALLKLYAVGDAATELCVGAADDETHDVVSPSVGGRLSSRAALPWEEQRANLPTKRTVSERWQDQPPDAFERLASPRAPRKIAAGSLPQQQQQQQQQRRSSAKGPYHRSSTVDPVIAGLLGAAGRASPAAVSVAVENGFGHGEGVGEAADFAFFV